MPDGNQVSSLEAEKRLLTEKRILRATTATMAQRGFSATVDEIAAVAGVSPRTIYRYFETRDHLIAAGVRQILKAAGNAIPDLPSVHDDLDGWIDRIALTAHARNTTIIGATFWDLVKPLSSASDEIEEVRALRRPTRMQWITGLSAIAWMASGGKGQPPSSVVTTFALALSAFTTHALAADFDYGPEEAARFSAEMIKDRLAVAVKVQGEPSPRPSRSP